MRQRLNRKAEGDTSIPSWLLMLILGLIVLILIAVGIIWKGKEKLLGIFGML